MSKIKILAIGNSFSQDATSSIELLTDKLFVRNLYYGGCSLQQHIEFLNENKKAYCYEHNGYNSLKEMVLLKEALFMEDWDYITIQQVSWASGRIETYYPYITELINFIKKNSNAEIIFHQTWSYEKDFINKDDFLVYEKNQQTMDEMIEQTSKEICKKEKLRMIPSGRFIAELRKNEYFDLEKGGIGLNRDGFHLNMDYGRIGVGSLWVKFFTGEIPKYLKQKDLPLGYKYLFSVLKDMKI